MPDKINIELSLPKDIDHNTVFELKDYFKRTIPGFEFELKEQPPLPGRMGGDIIDWTQAILYASTVATVEIAVHESLEIVNEKIIKKIKEARDNFIREKSIKKLNIQGAIRYKSEKSNFKIEENKINYFSDKYFSIDTDRTYVLLVGCGTFTHHPQITNIPPIEENLKRVKELFIDPQYFGIPAYNITESKNDDSDTIQDLLYEISKKDNIETFIFYYAGHGFYTSMDTYFLAAKNTRKRGDNILGGINKNFIIQDILAQSPAKQKIAIIDACYSGIMAQGNGVEIFDNDVTGTYILASSNADSESFYETGKPYTFFTEALINTITSGVSEETDVITLDDLYTGTSKLLSKNNKQKPTSKSALNIDPARFVISSNPAFSMEKDCIRFEHLSKSGKYDEASVVLQRIKRHIDEEIRGKVAILENDFISLLVKDGDEESAAKHYTKAILFYDRALKLKASEAIKEKINNCNSLLKKSQHKRLKLIFSFTAIFIAAVFAKKMTPYFLSGNKPGANEKITKKITVDTSKNETSELDITYKKSLWFKDYLNHRAKMLQFASKENWVAALKELEIAMASLKDQAANEKIELMNKKIDYSNFLKHIKDSPTSTPFIDLSIDYDLSVNTPFGNGFIITKQRLNNKYGVVRKRDGYIPPDLNFIYEAGSRNSETNGCEMLLNGVFISFDKNGKKIK